MISAKVVVIARGGDTLVIKNTATMSNHQVVTIERWTLDPDGKTLHLNLTSNYGPKQINLTFARL